MFTLLAVLPPFIFSAPCLHPSLRRTREIYLLHFSANLLVLKASTCSLLPLSPTKTTLNWCAAINSALNTELNLHVVLSWLFDLRVQNIGHLWITWHWLLHLTHEEHLLSAFSVCFQIDWIDFTQKNVMTLITDVQTLTERSVWTGTGWWGVAPTKKNSWIRGSFIL